MTILWIILGAAAVSFLIVSLWPTTDKEIQKRLQELDNPNAAADIGEILAAQELNKSFFERVIRPMLNKVAGLVSKRATKRTKSSLKKELAMAGNPGGLTVSEFLAIKMIIAISIPAVLGLMVLILMPSGPNKPKVLLLSVTGGFMLGYLMPRMYLQKKAKQRRHQIQRQMPDFLDLLTVSVEAGLGFDMAVQKCAEKMEGALAEELQIVLSEINMGKARSQALKDMADKIQNDDLSSFVTAIIQAEKLGASLGKVLRAQSDQMRLRRKQRAEEKAMQAPVKMMLPLVGCIFPVVLIVLMGSSAFKFYLAFVNK